MDLTEIALDLSRGVFTTNDPIQNFVNHGGRFQLSVKTDERRG
jgi:hypothetical protein